MRWRTVTGVAALAAVAAAAGGCRSLDPVAFATYRDAVDQVGEGAREVLRLDVSWSREGYADRFADEGRPFSDLRLRFELAPTEDPACPGRDPEPAQAAVPPDAEAPDPGPFRARYPEPPAFAVVERAADALDALNETASLYAGLLARLAGDEVVPPRELERLARALEARSRGVVARFAELGVIGPGAAPDAQASAGLVSVGAAEGTRLLATRRQHRELRRALERNQAQVEAWACAARRALSLVGDDLALEYSERFRGLARAHEEASRAGSRRSLVGEVLSLNGEVRSSVASLRTLWAAYGRMPGAHRALALGLASRGAPREELRALAAAAGRLRALPGARPRE